MVNNDREYRYSILLAPFSLIEQLVRLKIRYNGANARVFGYSTDIIELVYN